MVRLVVEIFFVVGDYKFWGEFGCLREGKGGRVMYGFWEF